jgi:hypothetical protein
MKEKYVGPAYGLGNWRKTDVFSRNVYDFSTGKTLFEKVMTAAIRIGAFAILSGLALFFLWLFGG